MPNKQLSLFSDSREEKAPVSTDDFIAEIEGFDEFGTPTECLAFPDPQLKIPVYVNEFWTSKQRAAHSLQEISYRACFKPQLPRFFIARLTENDDIVYDPFMGRGTTVIEAALLGRTPVGCDINPLSSILTRPRLAPPDLAEIRERLRGLDLEKKRDIREELLVFYHPTTLQAITNLREYLLGRGRTGEEDRVDAWIRMAATNRLTGHSRGFFSVYTMPPNQAVSVESQKKINRQRNQFPPLRDVREIILRKSQSLLKKLQPEESRLLYQAAGKTALIAGSSDDTPQIKSHSVRLAVTSPPFLDTVNYQGDNWLRCWFNGIDAKQIPVWQFQSTSDWAEKMTGVFRELHRVLLPGGLVAFEVGEVRGGKVLLETFVAPAAIEAGLKPLMVLVNKQNFTKTSNCWGVDNLGKGTNTNRIVLLKKEPG